MHLPSIRFRQIRLLVSFALVTTSASVSFAEETLPDPDEEGLGGGERIAALLERVKIEQSRLETLEASFRQIKESQLLLEPEESFGTFSYQAPDRARWEFSEPVQTLVVIRGQEMLTWYRELGRAERIDVGRQADRVMQYLSASNSLDTLQRYFTLRVAFPEDETLPYRIELDPRFARVARRIAGMKIWLDPELWVPSRLEIEEPDGDRTEYFFSDFRKNETIPASTFEPEMGDDVEVTELQLTGR